MLGDGAEFKINERLFREKREVINRVVAEIRAVSYEEGGTDSESDGDGHQVQTSCQCQESCLSATAAQKQSSSCLCCHNCGKTDSPSQSNCLGLQQLEKDLSDLYVGEPDVGDSENSDASVDSQGIQASYCHGWTKPKSHKSRKKRPDDKSGGKKSKANFSASACDEEADDLLSYYALQNS